MHYAKDGDEMGEQEGSFIVYGMIVYGYNPTVVLLLLESSNIFDLKGPWFPFLPYVSVSSNVNQIILAYT